MSDPKQRIHVDCDAREKVTNGVWYCLKAGCLCDELERGGCAEKNGQYRNGRP